MTTTQLYYTNYLVFDYSFLALKIAVNGTICDFFVQSLSLSVNCKVSSFVCSINCSITKPDSAKAFPLKY